MIKNDWYKIFDCIILPLNNLPRNEHKMFSNIIGNINEYNILTNKNTDKPLTIEELQKLSGYRNKREFNGILNNLIHKKVIGVFKLPIYDHEIYAINPYICIRRNTTLKIILDYFSDSSWAKLHDEYIEEFDIIKGGDYNE